MAGTPWNLILTALLLMSTSATARGQEATPGDSLHAAQILSAESTVDSLRAEIRKLDREVQQMKQDYADGSDLDRLLEALSGDEAQDAAIPEDTRSRRQRVDTMLKAITQRPGQLRFNGDATTIAQGIVSGENREAAGTGSLDLYASTSFGPATLLFFAFEAAGGEGLSGVLPLEAPINADAGTTRSTDGFHLLVLLEAWAEFTALGNAVNLTLGKVDLTNYFDINPVANDETSQFLSSAFVNSSALAVPGPSPGLRARTVLFQRLSLQVGLSSSDSTGGTRFEEVFSIGALGMRLFPETPHEGNLRAYFYLPPTPDRSSGWGVSVDQSPVSWLTTFGRYGENSSELASAFGIRSAWSFGLAHARTLWGRGFTLGAAYGSSRQHDGAHERTFEMYASLQLNTWTFVSPHLQIARNEATMSRAATVVGVRVQFNF